MKNELLFGMKTDRYCGIFFVHFKILYNICQFRGSFFFAYKKGRTGM